MQDARYPLINPSRWHEFKPGLSLDRGKPFLESKVQCLQTSHIGFAQRATPSGNEWRFAMRVASERGQLRANWRSDSASAVSDLRCYLSSREETPLSNGSLLPDPCHRCTNRAAVVLHADESGRFVEGPAQATVRHSHAKSSPWQSNAAFRTQPGHVPLQGAGEPRVFATATGACQGSCRLVHAASGCISDAPDFV